MTENTQETNELPSRGLSVAELPNGGGFAVVQIALNLATNEAKIEKVIMTSPYRAEAIEQFKISAVELELVG